VLTCGCSDDKGVNENPPENRVGPAGGTVKSAAEDLILTIPAGALQSEVDFTVEQNNTPDPVPGTMKIVSTAYSLGPAATTFAVSAALSLHYDETALGVAAENSVVLYTYDSDSLGWQELNTTVDPTNNRAVAQITRLSDFAVMVDTIPPTRVEVSGVIGSDTTWVAKDTIVVTDDVIVNSAAKLTIEAGAVVMFAAHTGLTAFGQLAADGDEQRRILFTTQADTVGSLPAGDVWNGVLFNVNSSGLLDFCVMRYATYAVQIDRSSPEITNCLIENFLNFGVYIIGNYSTAPVTPYIAGCLIRQRDSVFAEKGTGIYVYRATDVTISDCVISDCTFGLDFQGQSSVIPHFMVSGCDIRRHKHYGIYARAGG